MALSRGLLASLALALPLAAAGAAHSLPACGGIGVLAGKRVSVDAVRLAGVLCGGIGASQDIFANGDGLKVGGIHAERVAAQVVELQPIAEWAVDFLPSPTVGFDARPLSRQSEPPVAAPIAAVGGGGPDPALPKVWAVRTNRAVLINFLPEAFVRIAIAHGWIIAA